MPTSLLPTNHSFRHQRMLECSQEGGIVMTWSRTAYISILALAAATANAQTHRWRALAPQTEPAIHLAGNSWQEANELRNARVSASSITNNGGAWDERAAAKRKEEARLKAQQAPPTTFTHCDAGFCYDNKGGVYHRVGTDFMTGPNGRACHRAGNMWNCN